MRIGMDCGKQKHWHFQVFLFKSRQTACFCQQVLLEGSHAHLFTSCLWLFSSCHGLKAMWHVTKPCDKKHMSGKTPNIYYLAFMWQVYWPFFQEYSLKLRKSILKLLEWVSESRYNTNKQIDKIYLCAKLLQSCLTLWDPMECSLPIPSVHGILQARILVPVAVPSSEGLDPCLISCIGRQVFYHHCHLGCPFMGETTSQFKGSGG